MAQHVKRWIEVRPSQFLTRLKASTSSASRCPTSPRYAWSKPSHKRAAGSGHASGLLVEHPAESRRALARLLLGLDPGIDAFTSRVEVRLHGMRKMDATVRRRTR